MRDGEKRAVQTSLTRLFDTAMATRSRYPAVSSGKSLGFPKTCLGFSAENPGVLVLGVPSSLAEGRAKTRTPRTLASRGATKSEAQGFGVFRALAGGFNSKNSGCRSLGRRRV